MINRINNNNHLIDYVNLCCASYNYPDIEYKSWSYISKYIGSESGFFAIATKKANIIAITIRGTDFFKDSVDLESSIQFLNDFKEIINYNLNNSLDQLTDAVNFYNQIRSLFPKNEIILIGHSLGGVVAQFLAASILQNLDKIARVYSFDSPGIIDNIEALYPDISPKLDVTIINSAPNLINGFGRPVSKPIHYFAPTSFYGTSLTNFISFTLDQHKISHLKHAIYDGIIINTNSITIYSTQSSYNFYRSYNDFKVFWDVVINAQWQKSDEKISFSEFKTNFLEQYLTPRTSDKILSIVEKGLYIITGKNFDNIILDRAKEASEMYNQYLEEEYRQIED